MKNKIIEDYAKVLKGLRVAESIKQTLSNNDQLLALFEAGYAYKELQIMEQKLFNAIQNY